MKYLITFSVALLVNLFALHGQPNLNLIPVPNFPQNPSDGNPIQPTGVAVAANGNVFIFNKGNRKLMEFTASGEYIRSIGEGIFGDPHGLRIDPEGNIWTTDVERHLVLKLSPEGRVLMVLGENGTSGLYDDVRKRILFFKPADVAFGRNGDIYVADGYGNSRVVHLDKNGNLIKAWGEKGTEKGNFDNPHNIVVDHTGKIYVADRYNSRIQIFDSKGEYLDSWTKPGIPWGLAFSADRHIYMSDGDNERIVKLALDGSIVGTYAGGAGTQLGQLRTAHGIAIGLQSEVYVTEVLNWRVQKFTQVIQSDHWKRIHTINTPRKRHENSFVELGGKFYLLGGRNTRRLDIFDPQTNTWSKGADQPLEMHHFQAVTYRDEIYVMGAHTGPYPGEVPIPFIHIYNPNTNSWRIGGPIPKDRRRGAAGLVVHNDKFYLVAGIENGHIDGFVPWLDEYDPKTNTWKKLPDAPHARDHFHAAIIDGKIYAAGGRTSSQKTGETMELTVGAVDVYDLKAGTWTTLPASQNIPTQRAGTTVITDGDHLVVLGGESVAHQVAHNEMEALNTQTGKWQSWSPMLRGRHGTQAIYYKGKVYIAAGSGDRGGGPELTSIDVWEP